jgi:hypothetical protein
MHDRMMQLHVLVPDVVRPTRFGLVDSVVRHPPSWKSIDSGAGSAFHQGTILGMACAYSGAELLGQSTTVHCGPGPITTPGPSLVRHSPPSRPRELQLLPCAVGKLTCVAATHP